MISRGTKIRACAGKQAHQRQRDAGSRLRQLVAAGGASRRSCAATTAALRRLACRTLDSPDHINKHTQYAAITLRDSPPCLITFLLYSEDGGAK
jgi:hypothetical protein